MKRRLFIFGACALTLFAAARAETNYINGVAYECTEGVCRMITPPSQPTPSVVDADFPKPTRILQGYCDEAAFCAFLKGRPPDDRFAGKSLWLVVLLAILGGLAMNVTPCVLPMVPVNLLIIGKSVSRGLFYAFGIVMAYGALGLLAALGGVAFGTIQSSPLFNACVAVVFLALALSLAGVFTVDFARFRSRGLSVRGGQPLAVFLMGALSAVLAGACVAPILVSVLLLTAKLYAEGNVFALVLPFAVGVGLALPWPFLGAGLHVLPRPGSWMRWVSRAFAVFVLALAARYAFLAYRAFRTPSAHDATTTPTVTPATLKGRLLTAKRPVLIDCSASWCKNCTAMDRMIGRSAAIQSALRDFDVIRLNAEDLAALRALPGFSEIQGLPAFVIIR